MLAIHSILHPTDFSERSEVAFRLAGALARDYGATLIVMHVAAEPGMVFTEGGMLLPPDDDHLEDMREQLRTLKAAGNDFPVIHRLEEGNPATEILRVARQSDTDLIVMGTHGRRGLKRLLMGSVAEKVLRESPCPVLTVRTPFIN
ncbi:MAG: universal stress protein [Planctomycetes bacterium]|nr:universal stress protein [Planctomycetota bacterium]